MKFNELLATASIRLAIPTTEDGSLHGLVSLGAHLDRIAQLPGFEARVKQFRQQFKKILDGRDSIKPANATADEFIAKLAELDAHRDGAFTLLKGITEKDSPQTLHLKLPERESWTPPDFTSEVDGFLGEIDRMSRSITEEGLEIVRAEPGSIWIAVGLGAASFTFVAHRLLKLVYWWLKQEAERKEQRLKLEQYATDVAFLNHTEEAYSRMLRAVTDEQIADLHTARTQENREENINKTVNLIRTLAEIRRRGGRIVLDRTADAELKSALPIEAGGLVDELAALPSLTKGALPAPEPPPEEP